MSQPPQPHSPAAGAPQSRTPSACRGLELRFFFPREAPCQAVYQPVYRDEQIVLVRGRLPLANRIGWVGQDDTIAVIPRRPECEKVLERTTASLEYRVAGEDPFRLIEGNGYCPVIGFIQPVSKK